MARSMAFLGRTRVRQSRITRPTTGSQSRRQLTNRPLSHSDWFSKTASQYSWSEPDIAGLIRRPGDEVSVIGWQKIGNLPKKA